MTTEKQITSEIVELAVLRDLTQAYARIASSRMKRIREQVLKTRNYLGSIDSVFEKVRISYAQQVRSAMRKRHMGSGEKITFLAHNGKTVAVFFSANTGLYGEIVQQTFVKFLTSAREPGVEVTIIGRLGSALFEEAMPDVPYTYFDFPDQGFDEKLFAAIVSHVVQYEEIKVFYGKFKTVISQEPTEHDITAEISVAVDNTKTEAIKYLFEPNLEEILVFFESEMFASVFEQTLKESQLAKMASRVLAMDQASENIRQYIVRKDGERMRARHYTANKKQLNALVGVIAYGGL